MKRRGEPPQPAAALLLNLIAANPPAHVLPIGGKHRRPAVRKAAARVG